MALLLQVDSIQDVHSDVWKWRKAVTKEVITLQDKIDALLNGREIVEVIPVMPDLPFESVKEDTMMTCEESDHDVMTDNRKSKMPPSSLSLQTDSVEEIIRDILKLEMRRLDFSRLKRSAKGQAWPTTICVELERVGEIAKQDKFVVLMEADADED
ncbi:hypothetical protein AXG93_2109s1020 [Marchantia polymorpha subsp. ruderalis]|uniref:Uncharacterized protein n=1 Tax=Marchantia polymorpha subsp. ruderalis TaxID=1480154 RepID=A0A176WFU6_MARPO|nr:hypothetical protein AXG93_2109s1020 [Marchantia polymorpha subsp. ruderalis]